MQLHVGYVAQLTRTVTPEDIDRFAAVTGDTNPVHLDDAYARGTRFGGRIAHGMFGAGLISAVMGTQMGGPIYLGQTLKFLKPVRPGDVLTVTAEVIAVRQDKNIFTVKTTVTNQDGADVIAGEATILPVEN